MQLLRRMTEEKGKQDPKNSNLKRKINLKEA